MSSHNHWTRSPAVAIDAYGYVYALEASGTLFSFDTVDNPTELATGLNGAIGLGVDAAQTAYVAESNKALIQVIHSDKSTGTLGLNGLYDPASLAIDSFGDILVGDGADKQLLFLDRTQQNYIFRQRWCGQLEHAGGLRLQHWQSAVHLRRFIAGEWHVCSRHRRNRMQSCCNPCDCA